jgi:hypothetical protein
MTGNSIARHGRQRGLIVQPRDRELLLQLFEMRLADRDQLMVVAGFRSITRINARLLSLYRAGLIRRFFVGVGPSRKSVYSLAPRGAQLVGVQSRGPRRKQNVLLAADFSVMHLLAINDVYCNLRFNPPPVPNVRCVNWIGFTVPIADNPRLIPDGYAEFTTAAGGESAFLEVDLGTEELKVWKEKARSYVNLAASGQFAKKFNRARFRVLVLANSERRLKYIRRAVAEVTEKIFWFATLDATRGVKFYEPVWLRPTGTNHHSLFE